MYTCLGCGLSTIDFDNQLTYVEFNWKEYYGYACNEQCKNEAIKQSKQALIRYKNQQIRSWQIEFERSWQYDIGNALEISWKIESLQKELEELQEETV